MLLFYRCYFFTGLTVTIKLKIALLQQCVTFVQHILVRAVVAVFDITDSIIVHMQHLPRQIDVPRQSRVLFGYVQHPNAQPDEKGFYPHLLHLPDAAIAEHRSTAEAHAYYGQSDPALFSHLNTPQSTEQSTEHIPTEHNPTRPVDIFEVCPTATLLAPGRSRGSGSM